MFTLLGEIYCKLRRKEIERALLKLRKIEVDDIFHGLTRACWKYNIQYTIIIKKYDMLIIKLIGEKEIVVFKYHIIKLVSKDEMDIFMNELDTNRAQRGIYITTGKFEVRERFSIKNIFLKKDVLFLDNLDFIKSQLGLRKKAFSYFKADNFIYFKYLPQ